MTVELEHAREKVQQFIGAAHPEEVIFTSGSTMSLNVVAHGWARKFLKPGDEILLNEMEHHANLVPWQLAAQATGAALRFIPLTPDGRLNLDALDEVLTRRTKLVAVTAMSNVLGSINSIRELAARAHEVGAKIVVDGAQSVPHGETDVVADGVDFLAFSGHKLYGPTGIGVLYGRRELLEAMDPFVTGGHMIREVVRERATWADPPSKFEGGHRAVCGSGGLGDRDRLRASGRAGRDSRPRARAAVLRACCAARDSGADDPRSRARMQGAIASFTVEGVHAHDLSDLLDREGVAIRAGHHCTMPLHDLLGVPATARASFALYNTRDEVDALAKAIRGARRVFRLAD